MASHKSAEALDILLEQPLTCSKSPLLCQLCDLYLSPVKQNDIYFLKNHMVNGTTCTLSYIFQFLFFSLMHTGRTWPSWMSTSRSRGNYMARDSSFNGGCGPKGLKWLRSHHPRLFCVVVIICDSLLMQISTKNSISFFFFFIFQMWSHNYLNKIVYVSDVSINCWDFTQIVTSSSSFHLGI